MNEEWKLFDNGLYQVEVSNLGNVRTLDYLAKSKRDKQQSQLRKGVMLKPDVTASYPRVCLKRNGKVFRAYVHRLVALIFVDGHFPDATVDHIDGVRTNNEASNLRWVTRSENTFLQNADGRGVPKGEKHPLSKLSDIDAANIPAMRNMGLSYDKIGEKLGVSGSLVHKICNGERRKGVIK